MAEAKMNASHLFQTGGFPCDTLMIAMDENCAPEVCMYVEDLETDVFKVRYDIDGNIYIEPSGYAMVRDMTLLRITTQVPPAILLWASLEKFAADDGEYEGWEHLATMPVSLMTIAPPKGDE